jgi:hypothetical protein
MLEERRRHPRVNMPHREVVRLELRQPVQLLDISLSGALLACQVPVWPGGQAHLRLALASEPFDADLHVRRRHPDTAMDGRVGLGTMFLAMDDTSRRSLERFLRRASEGV